MADSTLVPGASPGGDVITVRDADDLGVVRSAVRVVAVERGLGADRIEALLVAVSEIATNVLLHGGGSGEIRAEATDDGIVVEVSDSGRGLEGGAPTALPEPDELHGRGLWLASHLCDWVGMHSTSAGTVVRLLMRVAEPK